MAMIRLCDIAVRLRLSVATVSRALNPTTAHLISLPVRLEVQNTAARLGYIPNRSAQQLSQGRSYTLGVVLATAFQSNFFSDHLSKVLEGIYAVLGSEKRYGCKLVVLPREKSLSEMDRHLLSSQLDGLLMSTQCDYSVPELYTLAERIQIRSGRPVVALNLPIRRDCRISTVSFDNRKAARMGVDYLLEHGRRRLGLVYADNNAEDVRERIEGFKAALAAAGMALREGLIARGDFSTRGGRTAATEILRRNKSCDALFCVNDEMAIGALAAVQDTQRRCPEEVAVLGFDGLAAGDLVQPRLTTVAQPATEMAQTATQLLIDHIEGRRRVPQSVLVPAKLVRRQSA
jgi:DNA-binding LacI/PurR family transcriptional regulator